MNLNEIMEFDHVVTVHADGTVTDGPAGIYAPDLYAEELSSSEWEFVTHGYTGQYGYRGPIMHNSEFIGGRLERDILATPGIYAAVVAYWPDADTDADGFETSSAEGWAVVHYVGARASEVLS